MVFANIERHDTLADYLEIEDSSDRKFELFRGVIYAMAGGSEAHSELCARLITLLGPQLLETLCKPYSSDMRIGHGFDRLPGHTSDAQHKPFRAYPDMSIVCGKSEKPEKDTIFNPRLLFEVTSASTESYDRGLKAREYERIESLTGIILVSHKIQQVTMLTRAEDWCPTNYTQGVLLLPGLDRVELSVDQLYKGIDLED